MTASWKCKSAWELACEASWSPLRQACVNASRARGCTATSLVCYDNEMGRLRSTTSYLPGLMRVPGQVCGGGGDVASPMLTLVT